MCDHAARRLVGVDVARGLALIGMAATHIFPDFEPDGDLHLSHAVASGRAAALFAVLAGVGLALATGGQEPVRGSALRAARFGVLARACLLAAVGLLLGGVESPPLVILAYYGLLFLVAVPVLGLTARVLAAMALVAAVATPVVSYALRMPMAPVTVEEPGGPDVLVDLFLTGTYPVLTWTTYLLAGLAVGRLQLSRWSVAAGLLVLGAVLAVSAKVLSDALLAAVGGAQRLAASGDQPLDVVDASLASGMFGSTPTTDWRWLTVSSPHSGTTLDLVHTVAVASAVLGACLLLARLLPALALLPLSAVGSMTFTLYTLHVLVLTKGSPFLVEDPMTLWSAHVAVAVVLASIWRTTLGRGPLEALAARADRSARSAVQEERPAPTEARR